MTLLRAISLINATILKSMFLYLFRNHYFHIHLNLFMSKINSIPYLNLILCININVYHYKVPN